MITFIITLIRGILAMTLGLALVIEPNIVRPFLVNFIGMFWFVSGMISLRWGAGGERVHGWSIFAGVVGVLAGLALIARRIIPTWVPQEAYLTLLGVVALLTGLMHGLGGFRTGESFHRKWSVTSFLLGFFEIALGTILLLEPLGRGPIFNLALTAWALSGGFILIGDALRQRHAMRSATGET